MQRNKDIAKAIFREEASGRNNKAASDVLDDGILTQNDSGVKTHSDRDPDAGKMNRILQKQNLGAGTIGRALRDLHKERSGCITAAF